MRRVLLEFYSEKKYPTSLVLLNRCLENPFFPEVKLTFCSWLHKNNFKYVTLSGKPVYIERDDIAAHRRYYLREIAEYREEGWLECYLDQTWTRHDQTPNKCWAVLLSPEELRDIRQENNHNKLLIDINGMAGGFKVSGGAGRIVINLAGTKDGFVKRERLEDIFISKKDTTNYYNCMNSEHFAAWFTKLIENLNKTVVVLDQAPCHKTKVPNTVIAKHHWDIPKMVANLQLRNIPVPPKRLGRKRLAKVDLMEASEKFPVVEKFVIQEISERSKKN